jgi:hypothetical protein
VNVLRGAGSDHTKARFMTRNTVCAHLPSGGRQFSSIELRRDLADRHARGAEDPIAELSDVEAR